MDEKICGYCGKKFMPWHKIQICCSKSCSAKLVFINYPELREKIASSKRGKKRNITPEWRANISRSLMGNTRRRGKIMSEEAKAKIGASSRGRPSKLKGRTFVEMWGVEGAKKQIAIKTAGLDRNRKGKRYEEIFGVEKAKIMKKKLRDANLGKKYSVEHCKKVSIMMRNRVFTPEMRWRLGNGARGKSLSPEHKEKLRKSIIDRWNTQEWVDHMMQSKTAMANTKPELAMKKILDDLKIKYKHGRMMNEIKHRYVADFFLPKFNCVIEVDGMYWHDYPNGKDMDHIRTGELIAKGYVVLRFWENKFKLEDVKKSLELIPMKVDIDIDRATEVV